MTLRRDAGIVADQIPNHITDPIRESVRIRFTLGNRRKLLLPLRRQYGGSQRLREDGNQIDTVFGRDQRFTLAFHKPCRHQLFDDGCPGCRSSQALALGILRHILLARGFHGRQ